MISIAMTTYNGEKYLREQLDSILLQTYKDFELIICDDKSSDSTKEILSEYQQKDNRIKVCFNEENLGFIKNFEKAISLCNGEYIAFSDQDDIWEQFKLERAINKIGSCDLYCSDALVVDENNNPAPYYGTLVKNVQGLAYIPNDNTYVQRHLLYGNFCQGATMLSKADFLKKHSIVPDGYPFHDWWYALVASFENGICYDDICTIRYRQHGNNVTSNIPKSFIKRFFTIDKNRIKELTEDSLRCSYITSCDLFPEDFRKYAAMMEDYYHGLIQGKILHTMCLYLKNYQYWFFDKNIIHKFMLYIKCFLKVLMIKISLIKKQ